MPLISTLGAMSSRGFGEFAQQSAANYIEDVFSTYLYTGNGSTQTITNGIDLAGKGGLVWIKQRDQLSFHYLTDTVRGNTKLISSNDTAGEFTGTNYISSFGSSGFSIGSNANINSSASTYASWTFTETPKFFDVVTYTGNQTGQTINHSLGSVPGMIIIKRTNGTGDWGVWHQNAGGGLALNASNAAGAFGYPVATGTITATSFDPQTLYNQSGGTYVAYLFATNAGGFGNDGTQNVISCGSYTGNGSNSGPSINLGWEPQWVMIKRTDTSGNWWMMDVMRGMSQTDSLDLQANALTGDLTDSVSYARPLATGFSPGTSYSGVNASGGTYIYLAIRRGPMRTPTDATKVYAPVAYTATNVDGRLISSGFPVDSAIIDPRNGYSTPGGPNWFSRLTGNGYFLQTASTNTESNGSSNSNGIMGQDGITVSRTGTNVWSNVGSNTYISWFLARAPGFFDVVCYTGTGVARAINHNLGVAPELIIVKSRNTNIYWDVTASVLGNGAFGAYSLYLNTNDLKQDNGEFSSTAPTTTQFYVNQYPGVNGSGNTYVAYLFATCPGVSKVGSYTGTGATQTISCGFTGGARYVLIKRTDSTGDWWVWDTARGMVAGTDPRLAYNSTAAETNADWVYTTTGGFQIVTSDATVNASGGTYIYLAIA